MAPPPAEGRRPSGTYGEWEEYETDDGSAKYYYNPTTGETAWELPVGAHVTTSS